MMRLCSASEHCSGDIAAKLERTGTPFAKEILDYLCRESYIDDARYARAFARDKSSLQGWGSAKIRVALHRKGIPEDLIEAAIGGVDAEAAQKKLVTVLESKLRSLENEKDPRKRMEKLYRFALSRGYSYEQIKATYDIIGRT